MRTAKVKFVEEISFRGHPNVLGLHKNTIEITKEHEISKRADCIVGVCASKACSDLSERLKMHIREEGLLRFEIVVGRKKFSFLGRGSKDLDLSDKVELVLRRSDFVSPRTGAVKCESAAIDMPRTMIKMLQNPKRRGKLRIEPLQNEKEEQEFVWSLP